MIDNSYFCALIDEIIFGYIFDNKTCHKCQVFSVLEIFKLIIELGLHKNTS